MGIMGRRNVERAQLTVRRAVDGSPTIEFRDGTGQMLPASAMKDSMADRLEQTLSANGAVTFDPNAAGNHVVILAANATSTVLTPTTGTIKDGQRVTLTYRQDATGGRTYVWPTNCRFVGGSAPSDTTANRRSTVSFTYESSSSLWFEMSRSVAVVAV